jgi:hypothetical protein
MKVEYKSTFLKSFKRMINSDNPFRFEYWKNKYYDLRNGIRNLKKYFKIVWKMRSWDYHYILRMMHFQITLLKNANDKYSQHLNSEDYSKTMNDVLILLNHKIEDNYAERCGYKPNENPLEWEKIEGTDNWRIIDNDSEEEKEIQRNIFKQSYELEEKEWNEMFEIMKKEMRHWWY